MRGLKRWTAALAALLLGACQSTDTADDAALTAPAAAYPTISWDQAGAHWGEVVTACGPVSFAQAPAGANAPPGLPGTLGSLVIGGEPTNDMARIMRDHARLKIVIPNYHAGFPADPVSYYRGKDACVIGTVVQALVGGYEYIVTHPSQIAIQGEAIAALPRGDVASMPAGAISYSAARAHIGETRTVCGVVLAGDPNFRPSTRFPPNFELPAEVRERLPAGFELSRDPRLMHELYVGDRIQFIVSVLDDATHGLPSPAVEYYTGKDVCFSGPIEASIMGAGATMLVEDAANIRVLP